MREIKCDYVNPPIPIRDWDFIAYRDGDEEFGLRGNGKSKQEAIENLLQEEKDNEK